jgi:hypothetical protein
VGTDAGQEHSRSIEQLSSVNGPRALHQTLGTRTYHRGRAGAARSEPASHACAPRNRRASVWHAEDADGGDALSDEDAAEGGDEMALHVLAYNLTRVMNIVGIKLLLAAIRA